MTFVCETACRGSASPTQERSDARHLVLHMRDEFGEFNHAVAVAIAAAQRVEQGPGEDSMALVTLKRRFALGRSGQHRAPRCLVQSADGRIRDRALGA